MKKEYGISQQTQDKFSEYLAHKELRDEYIKSRRIGSHKLASKYAIKSVKARAEFWGMVRKEYPELKEMNLSYDHSKSVITVKEDE